MSAVAHARPDSRVPASSEPRHQIGIAARHAGVSTSALRQWEHQGLLTPFRSPSGYRLYSDADLARLRRIRRMRAEHLHSRGIRRLLSSATTPASRVAPDSRLDGPRLRSLRMARGLSLKAAAERAVLSTSFLSALERNATGASMASLRRLMRAYGITTLDLFRRRQPAARRVRPQDREVLSLGSEVRIEQLARSAVMLEPQLFVLGASATSEGAYDHEGEEFVYVLDGDITFWVGDHERYRLRAGDALTFPSDLSHRWRNGAGGETRLLWINTPPTF